MVYYFTCTSDPDCTIYMGKDKHENEFLIKYAQHHDIWFHVDNLSSAHVYLRTKEPITSYKQLTAEVILECAQLTKANSIEGCKKAFVGMNYTWASNLLKQDDMQTGAVSYKNGKKVVKFNIPKNKDLIRQTLKTRTEEHPDFQKEYNEYLLKLQKEENAVKKEEKIQLQEEEKQANDVTDAKKEEWKNFFGTHEEDEIRMAGGDNKYLEDDFM